MKIYLAGPDVFEPDALDIGTEKKSLCSDYGFTGVFPLDNEISDFRHDEATAYAIGQANERLMDDCDIMLANMEPWHGPSMDVGTAYEMGYMRAQKKPVFGYSRDLRALSERVQEHLGYELIHTITGGVVDSEHRTVESFGSLTDNLMMANAIRATGGQVYGGIEEALVAMREVLHLGDG